LRSLLFIPADSEKKLLKGDELAADALILDLEDSVASTSKPAARALALNYLESRRGNRRSQLWVRINPVDTPEAALDLKVVMAGRPDGIVQPKVNSVADVNELGQRLHRLEMELGIAPGSTRILPVTTETPQSMFSLGQYSACGQRLTALTWGAEDLGAALGAAANKEADGNWTFPYQVARAFCLFGAAAAGVPAIDTIHSAIRDIEGLRSSCTIGRRDGFCGKLAIHPDQVDVINEAYQPGTDEVAHAQAVIAAFAAQPGAGTTSLDGQMIDIPHLKLARKILAMAGMEPEA
jgi:citrate lyase subunit beta/citryl-CoA lyase